VVWGGMVTAPVALGVNKQEYCKTRDRDLRAASFTTTGVAIVWSAVVGEPNALAAARALAASSHFTRLSGRLCSVQPVTSLHDSYGILPRRWVQNGE